jgi:hypothetical protein
MQLTFIVALLATLSLSLSLVDISSPTNHTDLRSDRATSTHVSSTKHDSSTSAKATHTGAAGAVNVGEMGVVMAGVLGVAAML